MLTLHSQFGIDLSKHEHQFQHWISKITNLLNNTLLCDPWDKAGHWIVVSVHEECLLLTFYPIHLHPQSISTPLSAHEHLELEENTSSATPSSTGWNSDQGDQQRYYGDLVGGDNSDDNNSHACLAQVVVTSISDPIDCHALVSNELHLQAQQLDPSIAHVGHAFNLCNWLKDSGASSHMRPCLDDLIMWKKS